MNSEHCNNCVYGTSGVISGGTTVTGAVLLHTPFGLPFLFTGIGAFAATALGYRYYPDPAQHFGYPPSVMQPVPTVQMPMNASLVSTGGTSRPSSPHAGPSEPINESDEGLAPTRAVEAGNDHAPTRPGEQSPTYSNENEITCDICMEHMPGTPYVPVCKNEHQFHIFCALGLLRSETLRRNGCPTCREPILESVESFADHFYNI